MEKGPLIAKVAENVDWARLWDAELDLGWKALRGIEMTSGAMRHHAWERKTPMSSL